MVEEAGGDQRVEKARETVLGHVEASGEGRSVQRSLRKLGEQVELQPGQESASGGDGGLQALDGLGPNGRGRCRRVHRHVVHHPPGRDRRRYQAGASRRSRKGARAERSPATRRNFTAPFAPRRFRGTATAAPDRPHGRSPAFADGGTGHPGSAPGFPLRPRQPLMTDAMASDRRPLKRALLSVSDKTGLADFAAFLAGRGVELISTGGTRRDLLAHGLPVLDVADVTGFPELMDGRLKTLHPNIHGGLLAIRENPAHEAAMLAHGIKPIDLLVVNLYPFEATVASGGDFDSCIETIDIGGPAMIRGAAKNHGDVTVVVDVADYARLQAELDAHDGETTADFRRRMAQKALARTAAYDAAISNWLAGTLPASEPPAFRALGGTLAEALRYGENPHQAAAFYRTPEIRPGIATARQVQGKPLSYNNLADTDAAFELVAELAGSGGAAIAIIKHANPCGAAVGATPLEAYRKALACDPVSAFGGIVASSRPLDGEAAREIVNTFTEVIIAPDASEEAVAAVATKKNLRLLLTGGLPDPRAAGLLVRTVAGGFLVQDRDAADLADMTLEVVTRRPPTEAERADLLFAWRVCKHVKSNAIVYARGGATVGIGAGQMSRVDSARIAAWKAAEAAQAAGGGAPLTYGAVVASDAFFPFADGVEVLIRAGATAVIQPGGSVRDAEVIAAADAAGLAMIFTGVRHFRH